MENFEINDKQLIIKLKKYIKLSSKAELSSYLLSELANQGFIPDYIIRTKKQWLEFTIDILSQNNTNDNDDILLRKSLNRFLDNKLNELR